MDEYISLLLLPDDVVATSPHLPLLQNIQTVLNEAYRKTYCSRHDIFGDDHVRLADPAQFVDLIKEDGFMVVLLRLQPPNTDGLPCAAEVVATGSVKNFGDGDASSYAERSENVGGAEWKAKREKALNDGMVDVAVTTNNRGKEKPAIEKFEVVAFAVSPNAQAKGLGVRVLDDITWLASMYRPGSGLQHLIDASSEAGVSGLEIGESTSIQGFDIHKLRDAAAGVAIAECKKPQLVLMVIRELGTEEYYKKRGFKAKWKGDVPVGMWACLQNCTMVYMEKEL